MYSIIVQALSNDALACAFADGVSLASPIRQHCHLLVPVFRGFFLDSLAASRGSRHFDMAVDIASANACRWLVLRVSGVAFEVPPISF